MQHLNNMKSAISTISVLPSGKSEVAIFTRQLKSEILANTTNPLPVFVQLKYIEKTIENILKDEEIEEHFLKEFLLYDKEKIVEVNGAKLNVSEVGTKYDYSASGDPVWMDLDKKLKELSEKKKEREKFLQAIPYDGGVVDAGSGLYINRPPKSSKTKVICKLF